MPTKKEDINRVFDQSYPQFLELMSSDPEEAIAEFAWCARWWLSNNPTPSMRSLTAAEQQDVVEETIDRCKAKHGEPLRNYSDEWGSFGKWVASVAEDTCNTRFPTRVTKPGPSATEAGPAGRPAEKRAETPSRDATAPPQKTTKPAALAAKDDPVPVKPNAMSLATVLAWFRSPRVLIPVTIVAVIVAVRTFQSSKGTGNSTPVTIGPIDISLLNDRESQNGVYDVLDLDHIPASADADGRVPMTAVFRSGRLTVLRLSTADLPDNASPTRLVVLNKAGEIAWDSPLDPESFGAGTLNLRIDPNTIVPDEYTIRVHDAADAPLLRSAFTIVAQ